MIYFAIYLIGCACLFVSSAYWPQYSIAAIFLFLGIGTLATRVNVAFKNLQGRYYLFPIIALALISAMIIPFTHSLGFFLLSAGMLLAVLFPSNEKISGFSFSLMVTGIVLIIISILDPLYNNLMSQFHDFSLINFFVIPVLKLISLDSAGEYAHLYIQSQPAVEFVLTATEKTGLYFSLVFFIGSSIFILLSRHPKKIQTLVKLIIIQFVYIILRYVFIVVIFLNFASANIFWNRWIEIASFIPLVFILAKSIPLSVNKKSIGLRFERITFTKKDIPAIIYSSLFVFFACAFVFFHDPGKMKNSRVLLDEKHSDWEWTQEKLDTVTYGKKSLYNYSCLADYIGHYYRFERNFELITGEVLADHDILIIKTPTSVFLESELDAIEEFVNQGGGLLLIGDHTNVFGTSTFINPLARRFGLQYNFDATYDFRTGSLSVYKPSEFYSHPVVQSMPPFLFGTSCTLDAPLLAEKVIIGYGLKAVYLDYSKKNFFSVQNESAFMKYGVFVQCAGIKFGKGRVLAFSDSTVFSNFWMFMPGKPELFSGFLNWLNRANTTLSYKIFLVIACLILFWMMIKQLTKTDTIHRTYLVIIIGWSVFILCYFIFSLLKSHSYDLPEPHTAYYRICIDNEYSDIDMPILELTRDNQKSYNSFYIALQRLGYFPSISGSLEKSLEGNDLVIIINNQKEITDRELSKMKAFLERGGKLLILENGPDQNKFSEKILEALNIKNARNIKKDDIYSHVLPDSNIDRDKTSVEKNKPSTISEEVLMYLSTYKSGKGRLFIMDNSLLVNDIHMGNANSIPNLDQLRTYRIVYDMLDYIVADDRP